MRIKRALGLWLSHHNKAMKAARIVNFALFHWKDRQQDKTFGTLNPDKKFFVIRSDNTYQGLLSLYLGELERIYRCFQEGFIPVVDWQNYKTQYNVDFPVNGTTNAWEYYFEQPCTYTLEEVYHSTNVRLSGWNLTPPQYRNY